jgi:hypothetical protein
MEYEELKPEEQWFYDTSVEYLRQALLAWESGRKAKAQELLREALYFDVKISSKFTRVEHSENLNRIGKLITRGY